MKPPAPYSDHRVDPAPPPPPFSPPPVAGGRLGACLLFSVLVHAGGVMLLGGRLVSPDYGLETSAAAAGDIVVQLVEPQQEGLTLEAELQTLESPTSPGPLEPLRAASPVGPDVLPAPAGVLLPLREATTREVEALAGLAPRVVPPAAIARDPGDHDRPPPLPRPVLPPSPSPPVDPEPSTIGPAPPRAEGVAITEAHADYLRNRHPVYPLLARQRRWEGTTLLSVEVLADGSVGQLFVARSSGHRLLDDTALESLRQWRFLPGRKGGVPTASWVDIPVQFQLAAR